MSALEVALTPLKMLQLDNAGHALVLGANHLAPGVADALKAAGLKLVAAGASPSEQDAACFRDRIPAAPDRIEGWLGHFSTRLRLGDQDEDLGVFSGRSDNHWDWIIDARPAGAFATEVAPPGYLHLPDGTLTEAARAQLALAGEKQVAIPRHVQHRPERCAHFNLGHEGCTRCLEVCPAGALRSEDGMIQVQPELCHGCGTCVMACPTGAIRYDYPSLQGVLTAALDALHERGTDAAGTVRIASVPVPGTPGVLDVQLPSVISFGAELWLSLLAMGWARVHLVTQGVPASTRALIRDEVAHWNSILDVPRLVVTDVSEANDDPVIPAQVTPLPSSFRTWKTDKARLLGDALARLIPADEGFLARPQGFPLGRVVINPEACTQCLGCVQLCPVDALSTNDAEDRLAFSTLRCAQCGICASGCPEQAIRIEPGLELAPERRTQPVVLFEVEKARCRGCGAPIMSRRVLDSVRARLASDPKVNLDVLDLCQECRVNHLFGFPLGDKD